MSSRFEQKGVVKEPLGRLDWTSMVLRHQFLISLVALSSLWHDCVAADSFITVVEKQGVHWFQKPSGERIFSLAPTTVDVGPGNGHDYEANPAYRALDHYPDVPEWRRDTLKRLREWGFNSIGPWSHRLLRDSDLPYAIDLELGKTLGVPWSDIFGTNFIELAEKLASEKVAKLKTANDANLLGYFLDNELGWWPESIFRVASDWPPDGPGRAMLVDTLRTTYEGKWEALIRDFVPQDAHSWDSLAKQGRLFLKGGGEGRKVIGEFVGRYAERYYAACSEAVRKVDPNHLLLGDRYAGWVVPSVARAAGRHQDVVSINLAAHWPNGNMAPFFLPELHRRTQKPILISEFYFTATENRSGNLNSSANFPVVRTQAERAHSYAKQLKTLSQTPFVVGAHWFQFYDEPTHGRRSDGEDYNMGLIDIHNAPYQQLIDEHRDLDVTRLHQTSSSHTEQPNKPWPVPKAAASPMNGMESWRLPEVAVPAISTGERRADLFLSADAAHVYVGLIGFDFLDPKLYEDSQFPQSDAAKLFVTLGNTSAQCQFVPKRPATMKGDALEMKSIITSSRFDIWLRLKRPDTEIASLGLIHKFV